MSQGTAVTFLGVVDKCITANTSAFGVGLPKIIFLNQFILTELHKKIMRGWRFSER